MKDILVLADYYLPGFKAGGPIRTLSNMVAWLGDQYAFYIITRDRDLGDEKPYPGVRHREWTQVRQARVRYLAPDEIGWSTLPGIIGGLNYDLLYLNSFFSTLTVYTLIGRRLGRTPDKPVLLAPRGEFYAGALALKTFKKRVYLTAAKRLNLLNGVNWQASSPQEAATIQTMIPGHPGHIYTAQNLNRRTLPKVEIEPILKDDTTRLVFIARISRNKNLDYALNVLKTITDDVIFDIYGPMEDKRYWHECEAIIQTLPPNITVTYHGPVPAEQITTTFSQYHGFVFPTAGENFGHVIWEALFAGCLPIISDRTPWKDLAAQEVGWMVSLDNMADWQAAVNTIIGMSTDAHHERAQAAHSYAIKHMQDETVLEANQHMLMSILGEDGSSI